MSALVVRLPDRTAVARHEIGHALTAVVLGWGVGRVSAGNAAGSTAITPPSSRSSFQNAVDEITILLAGRAACLCGDDSRDTTRAVEVAREIVSSDEEGQALLDYCLARAYGILDRASANGTLDRFIRLLEDRGELDLNRPAQRDFAALFEVPVTINLPEWSRAATDAPTININVEPTPITVENTVEVQQPDKVISFQRDFEGKIVEAESTSAPVAA